MLDGALTTKKDTATTGNTGLEMEDRTTPYQLIVELLGLIPADERDEPVDKVIKTRLDWQAENNHTLDPHTAARVAYVNCALMFLSAQRDLLAKKLTSQTHKEP